ncbi:MAG: hypothetical protein QG591_756 [Planctomycetota bacterium]|nr:hypothetical protein [Planctomycetota bacterium]
MTEEKLRILLVDDDEEDYIIARDILSEIKIMRFDLQWERTYDDALRIICCNQYDICLFDYRLGPRTGLELLHEVVDNGYKGPVIILTGQDDHEVDNEAMKAGAADYLVKGQINASLLERSIRHAMERKRVQEALVFAKDYAENVINSSIDMITTTNTNYEITEFNPAAEEVFGYSRNDVIDKPMHILYANSNDWKRVKEKIEQEKIFSGEIIKRRKNGETFPAYVSASMLKNLKGREVGIMTIARDITLQKRLEDQLMHNAFHDTLTGLPNRKYLLNHLEIIIEHARKNKDILFAVLFLDIDRFKIINDSLGHTMGDKLLISIAQRLKTILRCNDIIARFGGDEFVILLYGIKERSYAKMVAEKILANFKEPFCLDGNNVLTSASIGIVLSEEYYERAEDFLRDADTVMYRAKTNGRSSYAMFDKEMHAYVVNILQMEAGLRQAVVNNEFEIYYQPIISLADDKIIASECLIRWEHPQRGLVLPSEFIPIAEETGIIENIGRWVIKEAIDQNKILRHSGYLNTNFSINISARQFRYQDIPEVIRSIQEEVCIDLQAITLEITETTVMEDMDRSIKILKTLRDMGIDIMLDDFGTGYSSINNLRFLPVTGIKIDLSLTKDVAICSDAATIARAIINMAHGLNKTVVAEGVENKQQLEFLRLNRCDMVQGYLLGKPMPIQSLTKLLQKNNTISILSCVGKDSKYLNGSTRVYRSGAVQLAKKR